MTRAEGSDDVTTIHDILTTTSVNDCKRVGYSEAQRSRPRLR